MRTEVPEGFPMKVAEPTAEWHLPEERELIQPSPQDGLWLRVISWAFLATGFAFFLVSRATVRTEAAYTVAVGEAVTLIAIGQVILVYLYRRLSNHVEVGSGFRRLRTKVPEEADLPISIEIVRVGTLIGRDAGYMWLADGTWYFKGLQTAFRFNQQDVVPIEAWSRSIAPDPAADKPPTVIPMKSKSGDLVLRVKVIDPYEDFAKRKRAKAFYRDMYDWLTERPRGAIESLLPPKHVHPSLRRRGAWRYEGIVGAFVMVVVDSAVLVSLPHEGVRTNLGNFGLFVALGVSVLTFFSVRLAWTEFRDMTVRQRLAAEELLGAD